MFSSIGRKKISTQLMLFFVASIMLMLMILVVTYYRSVEIINENNSVYISQSVYQIGQELNMKYDTYEKMSISIAFNQITQDYVYIDNSNSNYDNILKLLSFLKGQKELDDALIDICIIPKTGSAIDVLGIKDYIVEKTRELIIGNKMSFSFLGKVKLSPGTPGTNTILLVSNVYPGATRQNFGTPIGIVVLVLDADKISNNINNMNKMIGADFYLVDNDGLVFSSNNKARISLKFQDISGSITSINGESSSKIDGEDYFIYKEPTRFDGMIFSVVPKDQLLKKINNVRAMNLLMVILGTIILLIPLTLILKSIINPLKKISFFMNSIIQGNLKDLKKRITVTGHAEVRTLADNFNGMLAELELVTRRLLETNTQLYQLEITKKQIELAYLQSQINPHFLYNTLESIKGIALYKKVPEIRDIAQALADIFRYSIKGEDMVALREEIDILKSYIDIQQLRFSDRLKANFDLSEDTMDCIVPKMILQPIAENAIYHGLELNGENGLLLIKSEVVENEILEITIQDNGIGLDDASLEKIRLSLEEADVQDGKDGNKRIGLVNVNNRIRLQYGPHYGITVQANKGTGTTVVYHIPVKRRDHV